MINLTSNDREFNSIVFPAFEPKGIVDKVMLRHEMMMRASITQTLREIEHELQYGLISPLEAEYKLDRALRQFGAEDWDDIDWTVSTPPVEYWQDSLDWEKEETFQSAKAYDFLMDLAEGTQTTELDARFTLSPKHFNQFKARAGHMRFEYLDTLEGFGEGPYPVALDILSLDEIITQTELQLHTIFEAYETVLEGAPDDHDHDDHDHDDHDHDEFETLLMDYAPYQPPQYVVLVNTSTGVKNMGEFSDLSIAQELADDWNAPGYGEPKAHIEKLSHINGAFRGLSRVVFEDDSYLTFVLLGDLIHRDSGYVNMTSLFVFPRAFAPNAEWWDTQRNN